jgi:multidrug efflux system membrane fusion protein
VAVAFQDLNAPSPQGKLTFINNSVDESTGTIELKATFPNKDGSLWPGQFVNVNLTLAELTNVVVVPSQAIQTGQDGEFVFVVKPDHTAAQQPVTVGLTYRGETVVQKGIQPGETVVTDGQLRLTPGIAVSIKGSLEAALPDKDTSAQ